MNKHTHETSSIISIDSLYKHRLCKLSPFEVLEEFNRYLESEQDIRSAPLALIKKAYTLLEYVGHHASTRELKLAALKHQLQLKAILIKKHRVDPDQPVYLS